MRIALDIDDVLARFMQAYCDRFETDKYPKRLESKIITRNVHQKLQHDREFWLSLEVKHRPNFIPELYCTKRVNPKEYTKKWLEINGFPKRPMNSGLPAILMVDDWEADYPYKVHSLDIEEISRVYEDLINNEFKGN